MIRSRVRQWAKTHPRQGFRRAYHDARGEGWILNHKRIQHLWREDGLRVPQRRRRKRVGASTVTTVTAVAPNRLWALDFQFDATEDGRPVEIVPIVDEHTRECLGGLVERSITAEMKSPDSPGDSVPSTGCALADCLGRRVVVQHLFVVHVDGLEVEHHFFDRAGERIWRLVLVSAIFVAQH